MRSGVEREEGRRDRQDETARQRRNGAKPPSGRRGRANVKTGKGHEADKTETRLTCTHAHTRSRKSEGRSPPNQSCGTRTCRPQGGEGEGAGCEEAPRTPGAPNTYNRGVDLPAEAMWHGTRALPGVIAVAAVVFFFPSPSLSQRPWSSHGASPLARRLLPLRGFLRSLFLLPRSLW